MRSDAEAFVQLALETLSCSQKELALRLKVSPTQVSKWKSGEYLSEEMEKKFRRMIKIGDKSPSFVLQAGSIESANKWTKLICFLARAANEEADTGYDTEPLTFELDLLCARTFDTLERMGVDLPKVFPNELDLDYGEDLDGCEEESEGLWDLIDRNPYSSLICMIFESLASVYGFYAAFVSELVFDDKINEAADVNIYSDLLYLAASKIDLEEAQSLATKFREFKHHIQDDYAKRLNQLKDAAFRAGVPLRVELMNLVYESDEALREDAELDSLGFPSSRLHPDIYMDELLRGMRMIHQVLPAIMKKLGMDDFKLDESELRIKAKS